MSFYIPVGVLMSGYKQLVFYFQFVAFLLSDECQFKTALEQNFYQVTFEIR